MNKSIFAILAIALLAGAGCAQETVSTSDNSNDQANDSAQLESLEGLVTDVEIVVAEDAEASEQEATQGEVKEFTVTGGNFVFSPDTMSVKKGDTVRITFKNEDGFHDFLIDEFSVATAQIQGGSEEVVEFVADQVGEFEYYCSVGKHREMGMKGILTVTE